MTSATTMARGIVSDAEMARQLQEQFDNEERSRNDPHFRLPSESSGSARPGKSTSKRNRDGKPNDALVAKYLQELYDKDRSIDETIFHLPSEGTVPQANYLCRQERAHAMLATPAQPTDELTPFLENAQDTLHNIYTGLKDAIADTIQHVSRPTAHASRSTSPHQTSSQLQHHSSSRRSAPPPSTSPLNPVIHHQQDEENWSELDVINASLDQSSYDYLKNL